MATEIPTRVRKRFWSRVNVGGESECWPFLMSTGNLGYGQIGWAENGKTQMVLAHRVAWELTVGPIPGDLTIDHICRNRICCNPNHLRLLTNEENGRDNGNARKTHCPHGHPYSAENTRLDRHGHRYCKTCHRASSAARSAKKAGGR